MRKDSLGDRMKRYEKVTKSKLIPRSYAVIRIDGKAFHTYTKGFDKPWDRMVTDAMEETMRYLCSNIQGVKYGYYQSDEISLVLTDFDNHETSAWFDNDIQKIVSVSASLATAKFNMTMLQNYYSYTDEPEKRYSSNIADHYNEGQDLHNTPIMVGDIINYLPPSKLIMGVFDSRVWNIPVQHEVVNYFIWRQQDAVRNSVSGLAQSLHSHNELHGKSQNQMQDMCWAKGVNWNDVPTHLRRGSGCYKGEVTRYGETRSEWVIDREVPIFTTDRVYLESKILGIHEVD